MKIIKYILRKKREFVSRSKQAKVLNVITPESQSLDIYWDDEFSGILETWGEGNVWSEIEFLAVNCHGKILDVACGTGKVMEKLKRFRALELYGCDISDALINKAINRGLPVDRLIVCDATKTEYPDGMFDYAYSIGSLEHFTEKGIEKCISECFRITTKAAFHNVPVSRDNADHGWIRRTQSYYNNSQEWWLNKFKACYSDVYVLNSLWEDDISIGKWFVCKNVNISM
jgi:ubiquinone/menaquinone biosynthesis C-methylase UbiE